LRGIMQRHFIAPVWHAEKPCRTRKDADFIVFSVCQLVGGWASPPRLARHLYRLVAPPLPREPKTKIETFCTHAVMVIADCRSGGNSTKSSPEKEVFPRPPMRSGIALSGYCALLPPQKAFLIPSPPPPPPA